MTEQFYVHNGTGPPSPYFIPFTLQPTNEQRMVTALEALVASMATLLFDTKRLVGIGEILLKRTETHETRLAEKAAAKVKR